MVDNYYVTRGECFTNMPVLMTYKCPFRGDKWHINLAIALMERDFLPYGMTILFLSVAVWGGNLINFLCDTGSAATYWRHENPQFPDPTQYTVTKVSTVPPATTTVPHTGLCTTHQQHHSTTCTV